MVLRCGIGVRLSLSSTTPVIKTDVLNYALQTGTAVYTAAVTPTELVEQQNKIITSCSRRRSVLPKEVTDSLTVPFNGDEIIPLIRPASLQLVRVRRQHIVNYKTAARTKRPDDLYVDQAAVQVARGKKSRVRASTTKVAGVDSDALDIANSDNDSAASMLSGSSDEENVREVQHMRRPLTKRRRVELSDVIMLAQVCKNILQQGYTKVHCKFRNRLVTKSLRSALRVKKQFKRNDEELVALKEALPSWKTAASAAVSQRSSSGETSSRLTKQADHRHSTKSKIPPSVISSLPKSPDGRRLCMRYVSKVGCNNSDCARGHFKPASLTDETKAVTTQRWRGLADEFKDL
ncbi:hypothetical protein ON010_g8539 [Phytophthora cinnamomi]|nr:hypothetical protein ON010_g8539 [Phytophthora cinnamomi]